MKKKKHNLADYDLELKRSLEEKYITESAVLHIRNSLIFI